MITRGKDYIRNSLCPQIACWLNHTAFSESEKRGAEPTPSAPDSPLWRARPSAASWEAWDPCPAVGRRWSRPPAAAGAEGAAVTARAQRPVSPDPVNASRSFRHLSFRNFEWTNALCTLVFLILQKTKQKHSQHFSTFSSQKQSSFDVKQKQCLYVRHTGIILMGSDKQWIEWLPIF